jgi:hypothetical protein
LWFLGPSRDSWPARVGLALFLLVMGVTHTTTLAIFALTLGCMTFARFVFGRFEERGVVARARGALAYDGPMLAVTVLAALVTYLVWNVGIWGVPTSLGESALVFPYEPDFFVARLVEWVVALRLWFNGPLFVIAVAGLLAVGRAWVDDDLARVSIVWLAPLVGVFGFLGALRYPYYRFFNTTLAWVILIGVGAYFALRFFVAIAETPGVGRWAYAGVAAIVLVLVTNLTSGFVLSNWNDPTRGWLTEKKHEDLHLLRANLAAMNELERPVVFVLDVRPPEIETLAQSWGITQVNGNTARHGMPPGQVEWALVYQGSIENFLQGRPTITGNAGYDRLARETWASVREGLEGAGEPLVVLASTLNENGPNARIAAGEQPLPDAGAEVDVWLLHDGLVEVVRGDTRPVLGSAEEVPGTPSGGLPHALWVAVAVGLLLLPGVLAARWFVPDADVAQIAGMGPALSLVFTVVVVTLVLAITRSPYSQTLAVVTLAVAATVGAGLGWSARRRGAGAAGAAPA